MALHQLNINTARVAASSSAPAVIAPLLDAASKGSDLVSAVTTIVDSLGFDTFMYGLTTVFRPGHDSFVYLFTTAPQAWVQLYDQRSYIEIDPRIEAAVTSTLPHVWDQVTERGKSARVDKFLDDAASYGIASGVSFLLPDSNRASVILSLNSSIPKIDAERRAALVANFGTMRTFVYYFHELFMRKVVDAGMPSALEGAPLTPRERECLTL